ncbi:hypothetical protein Ocin01_03488 [Orchesella cincta]|uniref:Uncharacterized protein n=1 Tax=Orchesella cincta TaxID=48709 RepID=A0A1D2ND69_ORCCI|nr:hypothetical protein Ocin01_03488 [Orchesella cincta]
MGCCGSKNMDAGAPPEVQPTASQGQPMEAAPSNADQGGMEAAEGGVPMYIQLIAPINSMYLSPSDVFIHPAGWKPCASYQVDFYAVPNQPPRRSNIRSFIVTE